MHGSFRAEDGRLGVAVGRSEDALEKRLLGSHHLAQGAAAARSFDPGDHARVTREGRFARGRGDAGESKGSLRSGSRGNREALRQLEIDLSALVAETQQEPGFGGGDPGHLPAHSPEVTVQVRRDAEGIGRAAVEAEEGFPFLYFRYLREPRERLERRPLQLGGGAGEERGAGPRRHQPHGSAFPLRRHRGSQGEAGRAEPYQREEGAEAGHRCQLRYRLPNSPGKGGGVESFPLDRAEAKQVGGVARETLMANVDRIKRQLLRDLVQQNVDLIHGRATRRRHRGDVWRFAARVAALAFLSLALFGSSRLISTLGGPRAAAAGPASAAVVRPVAATARQLAGPPLGLPDPVDAAVFPLAVHKIAIDAGHGGESTGTHTPEGLMEKDLTLDIAQRLERLLQKQSFQVVMTREGDRDVSLDQRGALANRLGADIFVSIHVNWIENRRSRGVETYYLGPTDDPYLTRLAASENRESG